MNPYFAYFFFKVKKLSSTVKGRRFNPSQKLKGCLPRIHGSQPKTQDVWVRGKNKYITHSTTSCEHKHAWCQVFKPQFSHSDMKKAR